MFGVEAAGPSIAVTGLTTYTIEDDHVVREDGIVDNLGLMQQLGARPDAAYSVSRDDPHRRKCPQPFMEPKKFWQIRPRGPASTAPSEPPPDLVGVTPPRPTPNAQHPTPNTQRPTPS